MGLRASAKARFTTLVALIETGTCEPPRLEGARSESESRPASTTAKGLATKLRCFLTAGWASDAITRLMSHAMSGLVLVHPGVAQTRKSVFSPQEASATPAKSPYGVGRVAIRI